MAGQSRKWMILVATIWIQAFTGTNFDFSAYSSEMKNVLQVSQVQLNYLATASDVGKVFGWSSGLALMYLPLWVVMFIAVFMGLVGYGLQWLLILRVIHLPYVLVFVLCLLAGCSICWFNTVCFVLCTHNFPTNRPLAISLTLSFNGVSPALYNLAANAINPSSYALYLLLNATLPLFTAFAALVPVLRQPPSNPISSNFTSHDRLIFTILNILALFTGLYLLLVRSTHAGIIFLGALVLLVLPLGIPGVVYAKNWLNNTIVPKFIMVDDLDLDPLREKLLVAIPNDNVIDREGCWKTDRLVVLEEEHDPKKLLRRVDFWLYYLAYLCGGTIGIVYSNNLGQIAQSLGFGSTTSTLITLYSSFSFFGRLLSSAPGFFNLARTGWLAIALVPTPLAFLLLSLTGAQAALQVGTSLIGLSSGFIFAAAVSITSELFGPKSVGVNHNIVITNIPIGSLVYGLLSAIVYDGNAVLLKKSVVCMGRECYFVTFVWWGCVSVLGLVSSVFLFLRTRDAYYWFERNRVSTGS